MQYLRRLPKRRPTLGSLARPAAGSLLLLALSVVILGSRAENAPPAQLPGAPAWSLERLNEPDAAEQLRELFQVRVTVTGYSSTVQQTDSTPFITANNTRVRRGIIALSRDLLREYTPGAPFGFGDLVHMRGVGEFQVEDTMNRRFSKRADIWFENRGQALRWGKQHRLLVKHVKGGDRLQDRLLGASMFEVPEDQFPWERMPNLGGFESAPYD